MVSLRVSIVLDTVQDLILRIDPDVTEHWDKKIGGGILPTDVKNGGNVDWDTHNKEMQKLADFEVAILTHLFNNQWKMGGDDPVIILHYFGIGTGEALKKVVPLANSAGYRVLAYDVSRVGYENGEDVLGKAPNPLHNTSYLADIESVCCTKYIDKGESAKIVAPRVLSILNKQEKNWEIKPEAKRKMARTARKIGKLLSFTEVLLIHPFPEDNLSIVWGDTTPHSEAEIRKYMEEGHRASVKFEKLGTVSLHRHIYTAVLIRTGSN